MTPLTPRQARAAFVLAFRELRRLKRANQARYMGTDPLTREWHAALRRAAVEIKPKASKLDVVSCRKIVGEKAFYELLSSFVTRANAQIKDCDARQALIENLLRWLAPAAELHRGGPMRRYEWIYPENNQGFGNRRYSRGRAELQCDHLRFHGVEFELRGDDQQPPDTCRDRSCWSPTFEVWTSVRTRVDVEILKRRPGPSLREQIRQCWARGVNPRVFNPWLPVGLEEKLGLDYFGGER